MSPSSKTNRCQLRQLVAHKPGFCDSKIRPEVVVRQNPTRILSALQGHPGFFAAQKSAVAKSGLPRKAGQILVEFGRAATRFARGGFFY